MYVLNRLFHNMGWSGDEMTNANVNDTPTMVYNGHLKFQTSVSLRIPLYGSRNLAYIACKMDYMCPL